MQQPGVAAPGNAAHKTSLARLMTTRGVAPGYRIAPFQGRHAQRHEWNLAALTALKANLEARPRTALKKSLLQPVFTMNTRGHHQ